MKVVIEIDRTRFKDILRIAEVQLERNHFLTAEQIIANGTPLPKDATNGDVFKEMFSNLKIYENRDNKDYPYVDVIIGEHDSTCYPKNWWNTPYKRGEEDADSN